MNPEDKELVKKSLGGDRQAFTQLFHKYQKMVHAMAFRFVGPRLELEDILQETFLRAYKQLPSLKVPEQFGTWLGSICKNVAQEYKRTEKTSWVSVEEFKEEIRFQSENDLNETQRVELFQKVAELPEIFREVVLLKYVDNLSYQEIALLLNITPATVNARLFKAKVLLKQKLQSPLEENS